MSNVLIGFNLRFWRCRKAGGTGPFSMYNHSTMAIDDKENTSNRSATFILQKFNRFYLPKFYWLHGVCKTVRSTSWPNKTHPYGPPRSFPYLWKDTFKICTYSWTLSASQAFMISTRWHWKICVIFSLYTTKVGFFEQINRKTQILLPELCREKQILRGKFCRICEAISVTDIACENVASDSMNTTHKFWNFFILAFNAVMAMRHHSQISEGLLFIVQSSIGRLIIIRFWEVWKLTFWTLKQTVQLEPNRPAYILFFYSIMSQQSRSSFVIFTSSSASLSST